MDEKKIASRLDEHRIHEKLMSVKDWKIKTGSERRLEYEKNRKDGNKNKGVYTEVNIIPMESSGNLPKGAPVKPPKQQLTRFSRVFTKSAMQQGKQGPHLEERKFGGKQDEKFQLKELSFDKTYLNRVLWDEHVRMLFLRSGKVNQHVLKQKPYLRLWMEALMNKISEKSRSLRTVLKQEINFLNNRYQVQRQLHFWHTLHSLTLDQLYHKKRQVAFKKRYRNDSIYEELDNLWIMFSKGLYGKVNRHSKKLIKYVSIWSEENPNSIKFKVLCDLYYIRGLALMHLEKFENAFNCFRKDAEIGEFANLKVSLDRTSDNIGRIHAIKGNYKQAIKLWNERLNDVTDLKERSWLFYGIAQCHALEENYEKAIEIVNKCISAAEKTKSFIWELNGNLLLANCTAMLGMTREANIRGNTITSLRAINRAYQCAVFLANVSVIKKIMDIVVHIYNSFKDIDISMLEEVWNSNLIEFARKAATMESEKNADKKNTNLSNVFEALPKKDAKDILSKDNKVRRLRKLKKVEPIVKGTKVNNSNPQNQLDNKSQKNNVTVSVYCDERELHSGRGLKETNKTPLSSFICNSPITAVEVITTEEIYDKTLQEEWISDSESDDS